MKKICLTFLIVILFTITGCGKNDDIIKTIKNKIEKSKSYELEGELEITNNENTYKYDVEVSYKKDDNFRVMLKNKINDHEQIILKNKSGVFVLTPSLNKSFKFQSEWPYNNSQSYLLQNIINDIENDNNKKIEKNDKGYVIIVGANYTNNKELTIQKIYVNLKGEIQKVEVLNKDNIVKIKMNFKKIKYNSKIDNNIFDLISNMKQNDKTTISLSEIEDIIYPMYVPENTYLENEERVSLNNGERVILTFAGDKPFTIIEETAEYDNGETKEVYGDVELLMDVFGYIDDGLASWISNGIEYYAVSENLNDDELLKIVNSISVIPVGK